MYVETRISNEPRLQLIKEMNKSCAYEIVLQPLKRFQRIVNI